MLKGAIVDSNGKDFNSQSKNLLKHARITTKNIKSKGNNQLEVKNNIGIVNIHIPKIRKQYQDFYITLYIKRGNPDSNYTVNVNNYFNNRLYNNSVYKTGINTQLYRTQPDKTAIFLLNYLQMAVSNLSYSISVEKIIRHSKLHIIMQTLIWITMILKMV